MLCAFFESATDRLFAAGVTSVNWRRSWSWLGSAGSKCHSGKSESKNGQFHDVNRVILLSPVTDLAGDKQDCYRSIMR